MQQRTLSVFIISLFLLSACNRQVAEIQNEVLDTQHVVEVDERNYRLDNRIKAEDPAVVKMIAPYKKKLDAQMDEVIGHVEKEMFKRRPNSALNNWFADLLKEIASKETGKEIDFAVQNYGGVRVSSIGQGPLTVGEVYELMPFDNKLTIIEASGDVVLQLLNRIAEKGGWPISANTTFKIENNEANDILINGQALDKDKIYRFALPDYIANGGDNCTFLIEQQRVDLDLLIRDGIIKYMKMSDGKILHNDEIRISNE